MELRISHRILIIIQYYIFNYYYYFTIMYIINSSSFFFLAYRIIRRKNTSIQLVVMYKVHRPRKNNILTYNVHNIIQFIVF